jgi:tRNA(Ser,Leu) C12 N-acetylase TAN1
MRVDDLGDALESVRQMIADDERAAETICRVGPAPDVFEFDSDESFTSTAQEILARYLPQLAGGTFHVRVHRRGDPLRLTSYAAERLLGDYVWESLNRMGTPAKVTFDDPDAVINVETLEDRGGMGLWPRETLEKYPFLRSN